MEWYTFTFLFLLPVLASGQWPQLHSDCSLEPVYGTCDEQQSRWFYNQTSGACEWFQYSGCGGNGEIFKSQIDCMHRCSCNAPPDMGMCGLSSTKFHFNPTTNQCESFVDGACGRNENIFATESACNYWCVCSKKKSRGRCRALFPAVYFSMEENKCKPFYYGGCGGNANNFRTMKDCNDKCVCNMEAEDGNCYAYMPRIYYDKTDNQCKEFIYGGCGGNGNRFYSKETCAQTCSPNTTT